MYRQDLVDLFKRLHGDVEATCGRLVLAFGIGPSTMYPKARNYAFYMEPQFGSELGADGKTGVILVAPRMLEATKDRAEAILRHEFGHAMDLQATKVPQVCERLSVDPLSFKVGGERRADALAESLWGCPIRYDACTVQSLRYGVTPRPTFLGE